MKKFILLTLIVVSLLTAACSPSVQPISPTAEEPAATEPTATADVPTVAAPARPEPGALPDDVVAALDDFLQSQAYSEGADPETTAPGLVLLVDTPDGRYLQAAGVASMEEGTPMQVDDRLEIGSNSKSFTIVLLLQLQEEGVLSLDDPLSQWLPDWAEHIPNGEEMTLRHLAQHTSGIWDYGDPIIGEAANDPAKLEQGYTPEELVQYAIDNGTPDFAPGEEGMWNYSNTGYILLGMVIEKATGQSLGELYRERIFDPLGLPTAALIEGVPEPGEITDGYWWTEDGAINNTTDWNVSQGWAAGGIAMTAEELMTYGKALAAGELFQNSDTLAEMLTFNPNGMDGLLPYGLGLLDFNMAVPGAWGHEGQTAGFQSLWYTNPETGVTVVGLTNSAAYSAFSFLNVAGMLTSDTAAGADMAGPVSLTGNPWQWVSLTSPVQKFDVGMPENYLLTFNEDGTINVVADCNNAVGSYTDEEGALSIVIGPMTMAACPEGSRSDQFVQLLGSAARYFFVESQLFIDLMADGGTMVFASTGDQAAETAMPAEINEAALDNLLNQWLTPGNGLCDAPGAVLMVDSPAGRYLKAAGIASLDDERPMEVGDRLQIGSNTKAFTVILALQLQEQGVLSMDDLLSDWLPELAAQIPNGDQVTLRQLASNTSGIWDYADPLMQPIIDANDQKAIAQPYTPQELVTYAVANGTPDFPPGEGWHYSSTNFILLGMVVEAASGKPLAELYQERIFDPLGMTSTSYLEGSPEPGYLVDGYYTIPSGELVNMTNWNASQGGAAGAIVSTAEDMVHFAGGLFGGELFEKDEMLAEMLTFRELTLEEGGGVYAGYGLGLISFGAQGFNAYGHAGQTPGFQSIWFHIPEADTNFIFLTNSGSCRVSFLPISLTPETFGLVSAPAVGAAG